jgi:RNA polymerase sigma-70 factor (ECF subfamily)
MTDQELLEGCRRRDRQAQRELFLRTSERIHRLLLRITGRAEDASDIAQDTYVRAFANIAQFDGKSSLATWLYRIAVNEALQFLRRGRRIAARRAEVAVAPTSESETDATAARLDVHEALAMLTETDRAMLLLRYQEGLDYRQIATVVGCADGTVASRLNRARDRLRGLLASGYGPGEEQLGRQHLTPVGSTGRDGAARTSPVKSAPGGSVSGP